MSLRAIDGGSHEVAHYDYHNPDGELVYQVVRYEPKTFKQRRPDGKKGWTWNMDGVTRYPYHVDELVEGEAVYWVEGEKDVDRLRTVGLTATTSPGGAAAWTDDYLAYLPPQTTLQIIPDNDDPGRQYAEQIAKAAYRRKIPTKIVLLPGVPPKGDVSDWLERGGSVAQLERLVAACPLWTPQLPVKPRIERIGDDWSVVWDPYHVTIDFTRYAESRKEVTAEITITMPGEPPLAWQNLNLVAGQTRDRLAKALSEKAPAVHWDRVMDDSCWAVVQAVRETAPERVLKPAEAESVQWLMPPLLPMGEIAVIFGDGGAGKSLFGMAAALSVSLGRDLTDGITTEDQGAALYLDWESTYTEAGVRLRRLMAGIGIDPATPLPIHHKAMTRPLHEDISALKRAVDQHRIRLVVIDSLAPASGNDPESAEAAMRIMRAMRELQPAAILVIAHISKQSADQKGMQRPYGSVFYSNLARNVWQVNRVEDAPVNELKMGFFHRKTNLGPKSANMEFRFLFTEDDAITLSQSSVTDPELLARTSEPNQILVALAGGSRSIADLHEELGLSEARVRAALKKLARDGKVMKLEAGRKTLYALPTYRQPDDPQASIG